jgi:rare lipoprotein A
MPAPMRANKSFDLRYLRPGALLLAGLLSACATRPVEPTTPAPAAPAPQIVPVPDIVPKFEPRSERGNPPFYQALGKRYFVLPSAAGYVERGVASWYGPGFHKAFTSNGERYDMYGMTAAHKTLPLPAYVQVTNLGNGRSIVVRVNDRGPFKEGRIIDLSYSAAVKLDMLRAGTALVEVRAITPGESPVQTAAVAPAASGGLYVQAGAFSEQANASKLAAQLRAQGHGGTFVREDRVNGRSLFRVRIGPIPSVASFDAVVSRLKSLGISDARLALD